MWPHHFVLACKAHCPWTAVSAVYPGVAFPSPLDFPARGGGETHYAFAILPLMVSTTRLLPKGSRGELPPCRRRPAITSGPSVTSRACGFLCARAWRRDVTQLRRR